MQRSTTPAVRALHVFVLLAFAVSQPLFDLLGRHAEFLIAHGANRSDLLLLTLVVFLLLPGGVALASYAMLRVAGRAADVLDFALVALIATAIALPIAKGAIRAPAPLLGALAAATGLATAAAIRRFSAVRSTLSVACPLVLAFPLLFLFHSPASRIVNPPSSGERQGAPNPSEMSASDMSASDMSASDMSASGKSVVVVVFDALPLSSLLDREDRIEAARFPHFAALAAHSHWFRNATTVSTHTNFAVPAILSGRYPVEDTLPTASEYPDNLFTALGGDLTLNVVEPVTSLCPPDLCLRSASEEPFDRVTAMMADLRVLYLHVLLPPAWTRSLPPVTDAWAHFSRRASAKSSRAIRVRERRDDVPWIFAEFLSGIGQRNTPALHFLHVNVPHTPYLYYPSGKEYRPTKDHPNHRLAAGRFVDADWAEVQALQRHLLQVGYCDTLLGQLVAHLERAGLFERTLLVVSSDHGVSMVPGLESRQLTGNPATENVGDLLPVPLFIKLPGQREGTISDRNVELVDVFPTILDALGVPIPSSVEGSSLLRDGPARRAKTVLQGDARRTFAETIRSRTRTARRIHEIFDFDAGPEALFDVGPRRALLGRRVAELPVVANSGYGVSLADAESFETVDLDSNTLPLHVVGEVHGGALPEASVDLVIAVNGTIRASTRSFEARGTSRFTALLPESSLRSGRNAVEVFVARTGKDGPELLATQARPAVHWSPVRGLTGRLALLISSEDAAIPVIAGALQGQAFASRGNFAGSLWDVRNGRVGERILMFEGSRFLHVHELEDPGAAIDDREHFRFVNPYPRLEQRTAGLLRFIGISGGVASEIPFRGTPAGTSQWRESATLAIEGSSNREGLRVSSGRWFPVSSASIGEVTLDATQREKLVYAGRFSVRGDPPAAVLVFFDGALLAPAPVRTRRAASGFGGAGSAGTEAAFRIELPAAMFADGATHRIRFFVLSAGRAVEVAGPAPSRGHAEGRVLD